MDERKPLKRRINGSLYITIRAVVDRSPPCSNDKQLVTETIDISKTCLKYSHTVETTVTTSEEHKDHSSAHSVYTKETTSSSYPIDREDDLIFLLDDLKSGSLSQNDAYNPRIQNEKSLLIKMTERMVPTERLFYFDVDNPHLLMALWNDLIRISPNLKRDIFPVFLEEYTKKIEKKLANKAYYHDLINALVKDEKRKDHYVKICDLLDQHSISTVFLIFDDSQYSPREPAFFFNDNGVFFAPEAPVFGKETTASLVQLGERSMIDLLEKYKDCFSDLEELKRISDAYPEDDDLPINAETKFIKDFINDVGSFAVTHKMIFYQSVFDEKQEDGRFDPTGKHVIDLFYLILFTARRAHGAYFPYRTVLDCIIQYKRFSKISIHDAINRILQIQSEKKFYENDGCFFCCYEENAFRYRYKNIWEKCDYVENIADPLVGFDPSEKEGSPYRFGNASSIKEISEPEAINRLGVDAVIQSYSLF